MLFSSAPTVETFRFSFLGDQQQEGEAAERAPSSSSPSSSPSHDNSQQHQQLIEAHEHYITDLIAWVSAAPSSVPMSTVSVTPTLSFLSSCFDPSQTKLRSITSCSDLSSRVYEGGFKLWECAMDLCRYLSKQEEEERGASPSPSVLDLGCGHGFPGLFCLLSLSSCCVTFQDLNDDVMLHVTMRNVWENVLTQKKENDIVSFINKHTRFITGDWEHTTMRDRLNKQGYTHILSADTLYSPFSLSPFLSLLYHCLHPSGHVLIASKRYYFGVGGGTTALQQQVLRDGKFNYEVLQVIEDGLSNIREIIRLTWKTT